jgi:hypothetical protein
MAPHICKPSVGCCCSVIGLEPDENCPVHGWPWPPQCGTCGRFLRWHRRDNGDVLIEIRHPEYVGDGETPF